ncbi:hypothetical protein FKW77_000062 [Venturia effusa]|uniref:Uncharacterized protein n=1 Tax=Venturia effusa TaxID=50376 RepID=A0A517LJH2_9PEZI|nr:hypothetical protein FKW77_000062 [Venturia effusa]
MLPFFNRPPPPGGNTIASGFVGQCSRALTDIMPIGNMIHKVYKQIAGDSPEKKEEAELRRLNIQLLREMEGKRIQQRMLSQLQMNRLQERLAKENINEEAEVRRLELATLQEKNKHILHQLRAKCEKAQLRRLNIKRRKKQSDLIKLEEDLCKLKIQRLETRSGDEMVFQTLNVEHSKQSSRLNEEEEVSRPRRLRIDKSKTQEEQVAFRELRTKLIERQLRECDDAASARQQAAEAVDRYRERKFRYLERQMEQGKRKRGLDDIWEGNNGSVETPSGKKRRPDERGFLRVPGTGISNGGAPINSHSGDGTMLGSCGVRVGETGVGDTTMSGTAESEAERRWQDVGNEVTGEWPTPRSRSQLPTPPDSQ